MDITICTLVSLGLDLEGGNYIFYTPRKVPAHGLLTRGVFMLLQNKYNTFGTFQPIIANCTS